MLAERYGSPPQGSRTLSASLARCIAASRASNSRTTVKIISMLWIPSLEVESRKNLSFPRFRRINARKDLPSRCTTRRRSSLPGNFHRSSGRRTVSRSSPREPAISPKGGTAGSQATMLRRTSSSSSIVTQPDRNVACASSASNRSLRSSMSARSRRPIGESCFRSRKSLVHAALLLFPRSRERYPKRN